jgi:hypothetical protein
VNARKAVIFWVSVPQGQGRVGTSRDRYRDKRAGDVELGEAIRLALKTGNGATPEELEHDAAQTRLREFYEQRAAPWPAFPPPLTFAEYLAGEGGQARTDCVVGGPSDA